MQTNRTPDVKLADPRAGPLQILTDDGVDVTTRVTKKDLEWAWDHLGTIMDREPTERRSKWRDAGHTEEQLRLLCGLFAAVTRMIPMGTSNFIDWLQMYEAGSGAVDDFVVWRMRQLGDEAVKSVLSGRDLHSLGLERIDEPVRVRRNGRGPRKSQNLSTQTV